LFFIHHISQAISVNHIVDRIAAETEAMIDDLMPWPHRLTRMEEEPLRPSADDVAILSEESGYIRYVDIGLIVALAKAYHVSIRILRRVGHFIPAGIPLVMVSKGNRLPPEGAEQLRGAFDLGPTRTLQQDIEFGVLQIVDIALKAISPAVNDPTTAISCVDQLSRILIRFASREAPSSLLYDPPGTVRASIAWIQFEQLLDSAFEQIRMYAMSDAAVSLRLLRALADITATTPDPAYRENLVERGRRVVGGCVGKIGEEDLRKLGTRLAVLESLGQVGTKC